MSKIVTNVYAIIQLSFCIMEGLLILKLTGNMIPTFNLKDCGFKSEIKFTSFDVYYSDWENSINFYVQGVNSININQTKPIQFNSKLHYNTSRKSDIDRSCLKSKLYSNFGSRCQIEEDESTVTILTELTGTLDSLYYYSISFSVDKDFRD